MTVAQAVHTPGSFSSHCPRGQALATGGDARPDGAIDQPDMGWREHGRRSDQRLHRDLPSGLSPVTSPAGPCVASAVGTGVVLDAISVSGRRLPSGRRRVGLDTSKRPIRQGHQSECHQRQDLPWSRTLALLRACEQYLDRNSSATTAANCRGFGPHHAERHQLVPAFSQGCTDSDNNYSDFFVAPAIPRNSSSPLNECHSVRVTPSTWGRMKSLYR
jgi:hypothetical protein